MAEIIVNARAYIDLVNNGEVFMLLKNERKAVS